MMMTPVAHKLKFIQYQIQMTSVVYLILSEHNLCIVSDVKVPEDAGLLAANLSWSDPGYLQVSTLAMYPHIFG